MIKTAITAFLTFLGLKAGSAALRFFQKTTKILFMALLLLVILRVAVPFTVWYFGEIGKALAPIWHSINPDSPATAEQKRWLNEDKERQGYKKCSACGGYHSKR